MMGYSLEILVFGLLSTGLLWEGVQCDLSLYKLYVQPATVQEGLCVSIPCNFTYDPADASSTSTLYGYWSKENCGISSPVATNDATKTIADNAQNRFFLSEEVGQGNCSLVINDAQINDGGEYCFRMEKEPKAKFNFPNKLEVTVKGLQDPVINFSGKLKANDLVNVNFTVPGSCYLKPPHVSCKTMARNFTLMASGSNDSHVNRVFDFTPSVADNGQNLTCAVTYGNGTSIYKETTILLNVTYPPQMPVISYEIRRLDNSSENETDASQVTVQEGDSVVLYCKAVGNPSASVIWLNGSHNIAGNKLELYKVKTQDQGDYICQAKNSEGSINKTFHILLKSLKNEEPPNVVPPVMGALGVIAVIALIIAIILIFKRCSGKYSPDSSGHKRKCSYLPKDKVDNEDSLHALRWIGFHMDISLPVEDPSPIDNDVPKESEKDEESIEKVPNDPEDLHYASLTFVARQDVPDVIPEGIQTDYAEIKR